MKKMGAIVLCLPLLMTGCARTEYQSEMSFHSVQTGLNPHDTAQKGEITFKINNNKIEVICQENVLQILECDWTPSTNSIVTDDFDFDGYNDLFVRMEHGAMYAPGTYFRFHPETSQYEKWSVLNAIGKEMLPDHEKQTLMYRVYGSEYWLEYYVYEWNDGSLLLIEHTVSEDGAVFETLPIK